jgi:kumamolisin
VSHWLTSEGFSIVRQDDNHLAVFAQGTVAQIQAAFQTTFARVTSEGSDYTSAVSAPSVPTTISSLIIGINGLQPHILMHKHLVAKSSLTGTNPPYLPSQIAQAYNASPLYSSSITGAGQTIAIAIDTFPKSSDLTSYWSTYGVNQSINNISFIQVVSGTLASPSGEETLDTEWASSIAPGAKVRVYAARTLTSSHLDRVYQQIYSDVINHPSYGIHQMSMSYGGGETYTTSSQVQTDDQYFAELASAGVTVFASSGDGGSTPGSGAAGDETGPLQVENPASDPNVTGVGGTSLTLNSNGSESTEVVWNNGSGAPGGGTSIYFSRPSWQTGTGVPSGSYRLVPDIACPADPNYGAAVILNGSQVQYGGTSWSSPTWAGFCALLNQYRANAGLAALGQFQPYIYPLIGTSNFRDITSGSNATANSNGLYSATTGYDEATGIGVPNIQLLAQTLTPVAPSITSSAPPGGTVGTAYSFTYTASGSPTPTFSVSAGNLPTNLTLSSTGVLSGTPTTGGVFTGTVTASNNINPAATQNFSITITQAPAITDGPPPSSTTINTAYTNYFTYTATGYPAPTFSVSSGSLPTGMSLDSASGIISGTPNATGVFTGTVTAHNGIGSDATQNFTITVNQAPAITSNPPPSSGTIDSAYSFTYTATGYPAPTFSVTSGSLPGGLSLSSSGTISGTPDVAGVFTGTITATNGVGTVATQNFTITIVDNTPATDTPTLPPWGVATLAALLLAAASRLLPGLEKSENRF